MVLNNCLLISRNWIIFISGLLTHLPCQIISCAPQWCSSLSCLVQLTITPKSLPCFQTACWEPFIWIWISWTKNSSSAVKSQLSSAPQHSPSAGALQLTTPCSPAESEDSISLSCFSRRLWMKLKSSSKCVIWGWSSLIWCFWSVLLNS